MQGGRQVQDRRHVRGVRRPEGRLHQPLGAVQREAAVDQGRAGAPEVRVAGMRDLQVSIEPIINF